MAHRDEYTPAQERAIEAQLEKKMINDELTRRFRIETESQMEDYYKEARS